MELQNEQVVLKETKKEELLFPFDTIRGQQDQLLQAIASGIKEKKHVIAHAPTGLGKTASALAPALSYALQEGLTVFFLTNRQTQHDIAIETLKIIKRKYNINFVVADLLNKKTMCSQEVEALYHSEFYEFCKAVVEKKECAFYNNVWKDAGRLEMEAKQFIEEIKKREPMAARNIIQECKSEQFCSYEITLELARKANVIIADYNYIFNPFVQLHFFSKCKKDLEKCIIIVDEAHNLPQRVRDYASTELSILTLRNAIIEAKKFGHTHAIDWINSIANAFHVFAEKIEKLKEKNANGGRNNYSKEIIVTKDEFIAAVSQAQDYGKMRVELEFLGDEVRKLQKRSSLAGVASFLEAWNGPDEGYARIFSVEEGKFGPIPRLLYNCLDPALYTKGIFGQVHASVLMSGTLMPPAMYREVLGIGRERAVEKVFTSPFPPENKLNLIVPLTTTRYEQRTDEMFGKIASICAEVTDIVPGNCALFFPSYEVCNAVLRSFRGNKKLVLEKPDMTTREKEKTLELFKSEKDAGAVLCAVAGANFAEGIDLPGNFLNCVVVVGLPLGRPDLQTQTLIAYYEKKFAKGREYGYIYPAFNKCLQSAGRCIRSETDKGAVLYLDERYLFPMYRSCFPKEMFVVAKEYVDELRNFFGDNREIA